MINHFKDKSGLSTRWAQMSKQEQIIEKKKMEIQAKLEAQKQAAALAAQAKLTNPKGPEDSGSNNIFSNDGSFLNNYKALLEKQKQEKLEKDKVEKENAEKLNKPPISVAPPIHQPSYSERFATQMPEGYIKAPQLPEMFEPDDDQEIGRGYCDDGQGKSANRPGNLEDRHGHSEDRHGHSEDRQGHSEVRQGHSENRHSHSENRHGHSEDRHGHSEDRHGHSEGRHHRDKKRRQSRDKRHHSPPRPDEKERQSRSGSDRHSPPPPPNQDLQSVNSEGWDIPSREESNKDIEKQRGFMGAPPMGMGPMPPNMPPMPPNMPGGPIPPWGGPPNWPPFMGPNGPMPGPPNMGPNGPMPPFFRPPWGPNGPPNMMNNGNMPNMPFMGPRPPFGPNFGNGNGPNFGNGNNPNFGNNYPGNMNSANFGNSNNSNFGNTNFRSGFGPNFGKGDDFGNNSGPNFDNDNHSNFGKGSSEFGNNFDKDHKSNFGKGSSEFGNNFDNDHKSNFGKRSSEFGNNFDTDHKSNFGKGSSEYENNFDNDHKSDFGKGNSDFGNNFNNENFGKGNSEFRNRHGSKFDNANFNNNSFGDGDGNGNRPNFGGGNGPNFGNAPFMPPNSMGQNMPPSLLNMPRIQPFETGRIPPPDHPKSSHGVRVTPPPPPPPKDLGPHATRAAADVARNGDHWESVLRHAGAADLWFLEETDSKEYKAFRNLVNQFRRDGDCKPVVKPEDKYEPEFSLEDDESSDSNRPQFKQETSKESLPENFNYNQSYMKREGSSQSDEESEAKRERRKRKKSRWGDDGGSDRKPDVKPPGIMPPLPGMGMPGMGFPGTGMPHMGMGGPGMGMQMPPMPPMSGGPQLAKIDQDGLKLTSVNRNNHALMQYAMTNYGSTNLSPDDWKKCEDNFKLNLLYQDMMKKRQDLERLAAAGKHQYEYDSDEDTAEGTWEHKLRAHEMNATERWACELTKQAEGKHHIGDFLPPEELKKFMEKYSAMKSGKEPDLSDYKEFKLREDNVGFKMLQKLGWSEGQGLGAEGTGIVDPINKSNQPPTLGLGSAMADAVCPDDDEFDAYRKRMMLAYRFRPNPLNNPRRPYY